jgi:hypothetical protein
LFSELSGYQCSERRAVELSTQAQVHADPAGFGGSAEEEEGAAEAEEGVVDSPAAVATAAAAALAAVGDLKKITHETASFS